MNEILHYHYTCRDYQHAHDLYHQYMDNITWSDTICSTMIQGIWSNLDDGWAYAQEMIENMKKKLMIPTSVLICARVELTRSYC